MALAMSYVNEVLRQFATTVVVDQQDWEALLSLLHLDASKPLPTLDRMTLKAVVGGYAGLQQRMGELLTERESLVAKIATLEAAAAAPAVVVPAQEVAEEVAVS